MSTGQKRVPAGSAAGRVDIEQRHTHAVGAQRGDHARADQRGAAGHDGHFIVQTLHRITSPLAD
jgi:hypothetical protein